MSDDPTNRDEPPQWADPDLSRDLSVLRARGEGQHLEYIQAFPGQVRELAKEIAAFATVGGGLILIGVENTGDLVGLDDANDASQRDKYLSRVQGIAQGTVTPAVTPRVVFARECGKTVLFIRVHKGSQPVYYCEHRPYVRHLTESRPATPEEVIERVLSWAGVRQSETGIQDDESSEFFWKRRLDDILVGLLITMDEVPRLCLNPGPDHVETVCECSARALRELIVQYLQHEEAVADSLKNLAAKCDDIVSTLSSRDSETWDIVERQSPGVRQTADELCRTLIGDSLVDDAFVQRAARSIKIAAQKARTSLERFDQMIETPRQDEVLVEASAIGESVLGLAYSPLRFLCAEDIRALRDAAMDLHLLGYHEHWYSCSGSEGELRRRLREQTDALHAIAAKLD